MNLFAQCLVAVVRTAVQLLLWLGAALFALLVLALALLVVGWLLLKALLSGRRPEFSGALHSSVWGRARRMRGWRMGPGRPGAAQGAHAADDVVDVPAHEVRPGTENESSPTSATPTVALQPPPKTD